MSDAAKGSWTYEYPRPSVTADIVVWTIRDEKLQVLLIRRAHDPFEGKWALPGGFTDPEEPLLDTAARELEEETCVVAKKFTPIGVFSEPGRDPRGWTVSFAFYTIAKDSAIQPKASDDARAVAWHPQSKLPKLAFDHAKILKEASKRLSADVYQAPIAAPFLPKVFSLDQLRDLYAILDPNFTLKRGALRKRLEINGMIAAEPEGDGFRFARK